MEGTRLGPYRLVARLGAGGMGEVWEGRDERLERRVALKRVRLDAADDPGRRERLRREARAVARLSHPAIVQIHDIVETEEGDWIVLEYVEGRTLADLLCDGPLGMDRVLPLAREISEGLAEAHGKGILHRDLKAENVVVTPSGHAKILDFGLAKRIWPRRTEPSLSAAGAVVGTCRAMSPEQAGGYDLDPRSDLFSFGTLLYEMVTGTSPFAADTPAATLTRICTHRQPPAGELSPQVTDGLSNLIDELLAKERDRRPRDAREVAGRLAVLAGTGTASGPAPAGEPMTPTLDPMSLRPGSPDAFHLPPRRVAALAVAAVLALTAIAWLVLGREPLYVAVAEPKVGAGRQRGEVGLAASAVEAAVLRGLTSLRGIAPLAPVQPGERPSATPDLARALAADEVMTARLDCAAGTCNVTLARLHGEDGRLLWTEAFEAPLDELRVLDSAVGAALRRAFPGHASRGGQPELQVTSEDYARYLDLRRRWREGAPAETLIPGLEAVRRGSPRFPDVYLLEAEVASYRFFSSRQPADLERSLRRLDEVRALAPYDPRPLERRVDVALRGERVDEAEAALAELERLAPGDVGLERRRALLLERRGDGRGAMARLRRVVERRPSERHFFELANLEMRQGEVPAARKTLEELLRRFPESVQGQTLLAQVELLSGSPRRAAELYEALIRRSPRPAELSNLGLARLLLGQPRAAADAFRRALESAPESPGAVLNLADAERLAGRPAEAEILYRRVLELAEADPAGGFWNLLSIRGQALAHLGRRHEAVAAIQEALRLTPDNPQVAYEAALVYAVVGEEASARVHAERALTGGVEPRWFEFPWFESLRRDPTFAARLAAERAGS